MNYNRERAYKDIREWFNGDRNYHLGISYLRSYGNMPGTCNSLERFKNEKQLTSMLREIYDELKDSDESGRIIDKPVQTIIREVGSDKFAEAIKKDDVAKKLDEEWKQILKELNVLKAELHQLGELGITEERRQLRFAMAGRLIEMDNECSDRHFQKEYYKKYGKIFTMHHDRIEKDVTEVTVITAQTLETLRKNISRSNGQINTEKIYIEANITKDNTKRLQKINQWEEKRDKCIAERKLLLNE